MHIHLRKISIGISLLMAGSLEIFAADAMPVNTSNEVFLTLTRTPVPDQSLPTTAETIRPEEFSTWSPQTAGDIVQHLTNVQIQPIGGLGSVQTVKVRGSTTNQNLHVG